ncbi:MAG: heme-binding protein [Planctomycetes bacterium]|nr:heme-binding protein [Planctomycetota bacterium]
MGITAKKSLTLLGARLAADAAMDEAKRLGAPGAAVAVVDEGGNVICIERLDGTFAAAARISAGKARTAALFRKPTSVFENLIREGRTPMVALEDFTPLQGGVPIVVEGETVGAVGVSGAASAQQDEDLALIAAAAVVAAEGSPTAEFDSVTHIEAARVSDAFAKGAVLVSGGRRNYMVHASRRDAPGLAEVHTRDTDILHVLSGSATLVTGGRLIEPAGESADDEIRAPAIDGGEARKLAAGDVVVVPKGTPHWFREVQAPMTYYVVKVR